MNVSDAVHATVRNYPGGAEALAPRVGMTPGVLRNKANPNSNTHRTAIEEASAIMGVSNDFQILHALAAEHGFVCTKLDVDEDAGSVFQMILRLGAVEGSLSSVLQDALSDNKITPNELQDISGAVFKAAAALMELHSACKAETLRPAAKVA